MRAADKPEFARVLNGLATIKPGAKLTPEGLEVYWLALSAWSIEDFRAAAAELARSSEFFPNPYHFEQLRKAGRLSAGEAWATVLAIARQGLYRFGHAHSDPRTEAAVRAIGGYHAIAMSETDQTPFLEQRFCRHFEDISDREDVREALPQIAGESQHSLARKYAQGPRMLRELMPGTRKLS